MCVCVCVSACVGELERKEKEEGVGGGGLKWKEVDAKRGQIRHTSRVGCVGVDPRHQGQRDGVAKLKRNEGTQEKEEEEEEVEAKRRRTSRKGEE